MRRTTSLSEFAPSLLAPTLPLSRPARLEENNSVAITLFPERKSVKRRHSTDLSSVNAAQFLDAAHFLSTCAICKRSIGAGFDTFMYRGEVAFCSIECRALQITEDWRKKRKEKEERKERKKRSLSSMKKANLLPPIKGSEYSVRANSAILYPKPEPSLP